LDYCHKHNIEEFAKLRSKQDDLDLEKLQIKTRISSIESKNNKDKSDDDFKDIVYLKERLRSINSSIDDMQNSKSEIRYLVNTSDILYNYYNLVENNTETNVNLRNNVSHQTAERSNHAPLKKASANTKSIMDYFTPPGNGSADTKSESVVLPERGKKLEDKPANDSAVNYNRASLLDQYLSYTDVDYINNNIDNTLATVCEHCGSSDKTIIYNDSICFCNTCFSIQNLLTDNEKPSYKDPPKEISYFSYKRINHYQEWLNQIQGKETTDIPDEVFDKIMLELKKQRIYNVQELNRAKIKDILKKLKINKYYEHIPYILNRITGIPNPNLTQELEEKLRNMFKEIQVPFLKHSPLNRKNFLSYSYVIHKFIQLVDKEEYLKYFPLLKSRDKLHQQEQIWKNICEDLGWKFIRSI
jgi:hypothetical protein